MMFNLPLYYSSYLHLTNKQKMEFSSENLELTSFEHYLTGVAASVVKSGTHEDIRDELISSRPQEHASALLIAYYGNCHLRK